MADTKCITYNGWRLVCELNNDGTVTGGRITDIHGNHRDNYLSFDSYDDAKKYLIKFVEDNS